MPRLAPAFAFLAASLLAAPALAQESGGLRISPEAGTGPTGLAQPLPVQFTPITAADIQKASKATNRSARHQALVARTRGDAGTLGGFSLGTPFAPSVQVGPEIFDFSTPVIVNNTYEGPVAITTGNGNVVQMQSATGSGPIALQQATSGQAAVSSGAVNRIGPDGNIVQAR
jgi:hypothetical protein